MMNKVIIGLGSNIFPQKNIEKAKKLLAQSFEFLNESRFVATKPIGYTQQNDFINGAVYIKTALSLIELRTKLKELEKQLDRQVSAIKFGPRSIDLDIVVFNEKIIDKDFYERDFLKNSVLELIPDLKH